MLQWEAADSRVGRWVWSKHTTGNSHRANKMGGVQTNKQRHLKVEDLDNKMPMSQCSYCVYNCIRHRNTEMQTTLLTAFAEVRVGEVWMHLCADPVEDRKRRVRPYGLHKQTEENVCVLSLWPAYLLHIGGCPLSKARLNWGTGFLSVLHSCAWKGKALLVKFPHFKPWTLGKLSKHSEHKGRILPNQMKH